MGFDGGAKKLAKQQRRQAEKDAAEIGRQRRAMDKEDIARTANAEKAAFNANKEKEDGDIEVQLGTGRSINKKRKTRIRRKRS